MPPGRRHPVNITQPLLAAKAAIPSQIQIDNNKNADLDITSIDNRQSPPKADAPSAQKIGN